MALKILMFQWFQKFDKYSDGSLIHKLELTKNLAKMGVEVHVITVGDLNLNHANIVCHQINHKNKGILLTLYFVKGLKLILTEKIDIVYTRHPVFGLFGLIFKAINRKKMVYEVNGIRENSQKRAENHLKRIGLNNTVEMGFGTGKITVWCDNYVAKHSDALIAVTPKISLYLHERCRIPYNKINVISNGANTDLFKPIDSVTCRKDLKLNENDLYVCFVGSISPWHGIEYIIQSASEILKDATNKNIKFLIVGDSPLKDEYIEMTKNYEICQNFIFVGEIPYEKVPIYINASDICIAPFTKAIGEHVGLSPLKIYEYLSCGKPVISSRFSDLEFIDKFNCGVLTEPENVSELEEALIKLLKNKDLRSKMGENGSAYILENNSWEHIAKKTIDICISLN